MGRSEGTTHASRHLRGALMVAAPLGIVVAIFGVSFGVLAAGTPDFGAAAAVVMSATTFAGSAQFATLTVIAAGGGTVPAILAAILLNLRYLPIGISVAPSLRGGIVARLLQAQLIVDESWAVSARPGGRFDVRVLIVTGLILYSAWIVGTGIGVVTGGALGDPNRLGLDGAFPALFLALLVPHLRTRRAALAAVIGGAVSVALLPFTPGGLPIIAASAAALIGLRK